jgi:hypothetical protein
VPLVCVPSDDRVSWFWANRAHEIGIAPQPIARVQLTADALLQAIDRATSAQTTQRYAPSRTTLRGPAAADHSHRLRELSAKVDADGDGVRKVVDAFERVCITSIGLVPTSDYADVSTASALGTSSSAPAVRALFSLGC